MIFTRKYTFDNSPPIILNNKSLNFTDKTKFLGLYLDPKLKWIHHINYIRTKCEEWMNILKMTNRTWWGGHPSICLMIYKSLIRSIIDYGSILYGNASKYELANIDRLQYKAIRVSLGLMMSTPTNSLLVEAGELPLKFRRNNLTYKFLLTRIKRNEYDPVISSVKYFVSYSSNCTYIPNTYKIFQSLPSIPNKMQIDRFNNFGKIIYSLICK